MISDLNIAPNGPSQGYDPEACTKWPSFQQGAGLLRDVHVKNMLINKDFQSGICLAGSTATSESEALLKILVKRHGS